MRTLRASPLQPSPAAAHPLARCACLHRIAPSRPTLPCPPSLQVWMYCVGNHEIELTDGVKDFLSYTTR